MLEPGSLTESIYTGYHLEPQKILGRSGWACRSPIECLPSKLEDLGSILSIEKRTFQKQKLLDGSRTLYQGGLLSHTMRDSVLKGRPIAGYGGAHL